MKKIIVILLMICLCFLSACNSNELNGQINNNDWSYMLPNNYEICHVNSRKIICGKRNSQHSTSSIVDKYVVEFCYNDRYVCLTCLTEDSNNNESISEHNLEFYIIDTSEDYVLGPYMREEFFEKISNKNFVDLSSWIATKPRPEGATFQ